MASRIRSLWRAIRYRSRFERDMDDELRFHLEARTDDLVRSGLSRDAAERRARLDFGNPEVYQDRCRESRRLQLFDDLAGDLRYAVRSIGKDRLLAASILVTLALGIGATTATFSVVNAVLLRPLPFPHPDRLMFVSAGGGRGEQLGRAFAPDFAEWRAGCRACEEMAAYSGTWPTNVSGEAGDPDRVRIAHVTDRFFATLGARPILGRGLPAGEEGRALFGASASSAPRSIVLGHGLWQRRFGGDPAVVGRVVRVEGDSCTIVGVMPAGFTFPGDADAWMPTALGTTRGNAFLLVITRLKDGVTESQAGAELSAIAARLARLFPKTNAKLDVALVPLHEQMVGNVRRSLGTLLAAVGLVLLIACANVASLLLAHAATRPREMAIRATLGAGRLRIARQLLTESVVLALAGGLLGILVAAWLVATLAPAAPEAIPRLDMTVIDRRVLAFALGTSLATGLLFGCAPLWRVLTGDLILALKVGTTRVARDRVRQALVVGEIALALVLLIGAGLLFQSFVRLRTVALGFDPASTLVASITLPEATYPTATEARRLYERALARVSALPGVEAAGVTSALPLNRAGARIQGDLTVEGEAGERPGRWASKLAVGGDYFRAMGIPLVRGRLFDERDAESAGGGIVVSERLAQRLFPGQNALGRRLNIGFTRETWREIVGVVGDVRQDAISTVPVAAVYQPYQQVSDSRRWMLADVTFVLRTASDPEALVEPLRAAFREIDPDLPLYDVAVMNRVVDRQVSDPKFYASLAGGFSALALLLAAAGIHGLIACGVAQRSREIGIRMALGATAMGVRRMVVAEGMMLTGAGVAIGLAGALAVTRLLSTWVYQVTVTDPATFVTLSVTVLAVAFAACWLPARRATLVDPGAALKED
jgi:putative ABC transport system permease protein